METKSGIYVIRNKENGKEYYGQGLNVEKRMWQYHKNCKVLNRALKKYGEEKFERKIVIYCEEQELTRIETACIKIFHSHVTEGGYNISWGGNTPMRGRKRTKKWRKNHSERMSGENHPFWGTHRSLETIKKISMANTGKTPSKKTRKNMSVAAQKRIHTPEENMKISNTMLGKQRGRKNVKNKTSVYLGVCKEKRRKSFTIQITYKQIVYHLVYCKSEIDAAKIYDSAIFFLYGEKAILNFPEDYK